MTAPLASLSPGAVVMFDSDYDAAFADQDALDGKPEAVILWVLGAIAILLVGLVLGLGQII